ncbi:hypothetical protein [Flavobacterium crassostreae]|uniref:Uncharacterized protein n=1 Tax=Flavobacterium crassostreae TaxID=1763534 RepID=A0A1B9E2E4_9FLAO|nr:hypothetical protein [Flavobacterium crassostreae]OCB76114.1 hypothetical protein LPBF_07325 [Flavobacterium crassostreae]
MKKILFLALMVTLICCKKEVESENKSNQKEIAKSKDTTNISSKDLNPYLKLNPELFEYEIIGIPEMHRFTDAEILFPLKENDFDYTKSKDFNYYTAKEFVVEGNQLKIIIFNTYGENDSKVLNVQLNSYRANQLKDALLLDCRFTFETEYYRNFSIKNDRIEITKISVESLLFNEDGDIVGEKKTKDTLSSVVRYKLDSKGMFVTQ